MNKDAPKILIILLNPVIQLSDLLLVQKSEDALFELAAAFTGDDLYQGDAFFDRLLDDPVQFGINLSTTVVDVVQIEF